MARLGDIVTFTVPDAHKTKTLLHRNGQAVHVDGSIYHRETTKFAAIVTRVHDDGRADLYLFVPGNATGNTVEGVHEAEHDADEAGRFV